MEPSSSHTTLTSCVAATWGLLLGLLLVWSIAMSDDEAAVDVLQETAVSDPIPTQEPAVVSATVDVVDGEAAAETAEEPAPRVSTPPPPRVSAWARPIIKAADVSFFSFPILFLLFFFPFPK